jgi:DNA-binding NtrC family response regulator
MVAATHQDLEALIRGGKFREDLFYRLNVIPLRTPSLRERREDIFELAVYFLGLHSQRVAKSVTHLDDGAVEALTAYDWPGNIRELENVIERAVVLADSPAVTREDLPQEVRKSSALSGSPRRRERAVFAASGSSLSTTNFVARTAEIADEPWDAELAAYERRRLLDALSEARGNKSEAARLLGMPRSTFCSRLAKHGLKG